MWWIFKEIHSRWYSIDDDLLLPSAEDANKNFTILSNSLYLSRGRFIYLKDDLAVRLVRKYSAHFYSSIIIILTLYEAFSTLAVLFVRKKSTNSSTSILFLSCSLMPL